MAQAKFAVGQLVHHRKFDYRGVVLDVDPEFRGTEEWYQLMARSRPPRNQPWYHVLVDGASHATYVAERHLEPDAEGGQVSHPALGQYFDRFIDGRYRPRRRAN